MAVDWTKDKIYDRCAYLNCYNGKNSTGHKLFRFPAYTDSRHNLWIRYTGNTRLRTWASASVRRAGLCGEHFSPESFTDETRQTLRRTAVPKPYSSVNEQAEASPTLIAHVQSLPRKRKFSRCVLDRISATVDCSNSNENSKELDDPLSDPIETPVSDATNILRNVKMIKIGNSSSGSIELRRCENPATCPKYRHGEKLRPHFHKVDTKREQSSVDKSSTCNSEQVIKEEIDIDEEYRPHFVDVEKILIKDEPTSEDESPNDKSSRPF